MTKYTKTGEELGSSESGVLVLGKTSFQTRDEIYNNHFNTIHNVEPLSEHRETYAMRRGKHEEKAIADLFFEELQIALKKLNEENNTKYKVRMVHPKDAYRPQDYNEDLAKYRLGASVDRFLLASHPIFLEVCGTHINLMKGRNILEIKSDYYHNEKPKPEWQVQVQHQFICAGASSGLIVCKDQRGKLNIYQQEVSEKMCNLIMKTSLEFWKRIEDEEPYPKIVEPEDNSLRAAILDETMLKKTNQDIQNLV